MSDFGDGRLLDLETERAREPLGHAGLIVDGLLHVGTVVLLGHFDRVLGVVAVAGSRQAELHLVGDAHVLVDHCHLEIFDFVFRTSESVLKMFFEKLSNHSKPKSR